VNDGLINENGETVLLRLSEDVITSPAASFRTRLTDPLGKVRLTVCVVDDSLAPLRDVEKYTYYGVLRELLQKEYPARKITTRRVGGDRAGHYDPLARIGKLPAQVVAVSPDLVLVAGSMRDLTNYVPPGRYERYLYALVDRLRGVTDAEIVLITLPPIIRNPQLSKEYARSTIRVALRRGLKVVDVYSAFTRSGERRAWEKFFRDPREPNVFYLQPNRDGQRIIADRILKVLLKE